MEEALAAARLKLEDMKSVVSEQAQDE